MLTSALQSVDQVLRKFDGKTITAGSQQDFLNECADILGAERFNQECALFWCDVVYGRVLWKKKVGSPFEAALLRWKSTLRASAAYLHLVPLLLGEEFGNEKPSASLAITTPTCSRHA